MMMDEEEITWNLKGPKRMKKRRELNALIRNNVKYKSLLARPHSCAHKSDEFSMINCSSSNNANGSAATGGGASGRLLNGLNYSSTDEDEQRDFYYAANKSIIKEKSRSFYCKIFQMILVGCFLTLLILVGIILLFSYSKFHELLSDLKREVDTQNAHNRKSIEDLTKQMDQYDLMLKQLEAKVSGGTNEKSTFKDSQERNPRETSPKRVARSIRSLDALNKVNTHLIRWLFNETFINEGNETTSTTPMTGTTRRQQAKAFMNNNQKRVLNSMMLSKARRNEIYQKVIDEFLKSNYDVAMILSSSSSSANGSNDEYLAVDDIGAELEAYFEGFEQSIKNDILYEIEKSVIKPLMETLSKCKCSQNTTITQPQAA